MRARTSGELISGTTMSVPSTASAYSVWIAVRSTRVRERLQVSLLL